MMYNEITILKWLFHVEVMEQRWAGRYYPQMVFWCKIRHKFQEKEKAETAVKILLFEVWIRKERNGPAFTLLVVQNIRSHMNLHDSLTGGLWLRANQHEDEPPKIARPKISS